MNETPILLPMVALIGWTLLVLTMVGFGRVRAAFAGRVRPKDFALGESTDVPTDVALPNRNFMNLLEVPMLFYVVSLAMFATHSAGAVNVGLAWTYVATRVAHTFVHVGYNDVLHRLVVFVVSVSVLAAMWVRLAMTLVA